MAGREAGGQAARHVHAAGGARPTTYALSCNTLTSRHATLFRPASRRVYARGAPGARPAPASRPPAPRVAARPPRAAGRPRSAPAEGPPPGLVDLPHPAASPGPGRALPHRPRRPRQAATRSPRQSPARRPAARCGLARPAAAQRRTAQRARSPRSRRRAGRPRGRLQGPKQGLQKTRPPAGAAYPATAAWQRRQCSPRRAPCARSTRVSMPRDTGARTRTRADIQQCISVLASRPC